MNRDSAIVIGIDGGGTQSLAVAVDSTGRVLATAKAGSLNFFSSGLPAARRHLKQLVGALRRRLPSRTQFKKIVVGCAALFAEATGPEKEKLCRGILPLARTRVLGDGQTAWFGATLGRPGLVIIAGTGSIVLARDAAGQLARGGGWGHLLGDAGSAFWIALESLKAAIAAEEGLGPKTALSEVVRRWFDADVLTEIVPVIYRADFAKERFARLSSHLARRLGNGDAVFRKICQRAGRELAAQAAAAMQQARLDTRPTPVYLMGSVLRNNPLVRATLVAALRETCAVRVLRPRLCPALGASAMAWVEAGVALTSDRVATLAKFE